MTFTAQKLKRLRVACRVSLNRFIPRRSTIKYKLSFFVVVSIYIICILFLTMNQSSKPLPPMSAWMRYFEIAVRQSELPCSNSTGVNATSDEKPSQRSVSQKALEAELNARLASSANTTKTSEKIKPVRVRFLLVSTEVDWKICNAAASFAFGGLYFPVLGFNKEYSHIFRFETYLDFIEREKLSDEDIVIVIDSDIAWTGVDIMPYLEKFVRYTPDSESQLDLAAVRAWEDYGQKTTPLFMNSLPKETANQTRPPFQMPPILFNADDDCYFRWNAKDHLGCFAAHNVMEHLLAATRNGATNFSLPAAAKVAGQSEEEFKNVLVKFFRGGKGNDLLSLRESDTPDTRSKDDQLYYHNQYTKERTPTRFVNAGIFIARVWAFKEMADAVLRSADELTPIGNPVWDCDQSLLGLFYIESRIWELNNSLLLTTGHRGDKLHRNLFGLPVGLIGLDQRSELAMLSQAHYRSHISSTTNYWRTYRNNWVGDLPNLSLSRGNVLVTPPLLRRRSEMIDSLFAYETTEDSSRDVAYPVIFHFASFEKRERFLELRPKMGWYLAARRSVEAAQILNEKLRHVEVEFWTTQNRFYVNFLDMCMNPLEE